MKKRAVETTIATILIFVVIAVILIIFAGKVVDLLQESRAREVCRDSIVAASIVKPKIPGTQASITESPFKVDCQMFFLDIKKDGIYENQKRIKKFDTGTDVEEEIKQAVANEMYDCWYQVKYVAENNATPFGGVFFPKNKCIMCTRINFDKEFTQLSQINNFNQWLKEKKPLASGTAYEDFFGTEIPGINSVKTDGSYYVFASFARGDTWKSMLKSIPKGGEVTLATATSGAVLGGAGGAVLGAVGGAIAGGVMGGPFGAIGGLFWGGISGAKVGFVVGGAAGTAGGAVWTFATKTIYTSMIISRPEGVENFCQEIYN